MTPAECLKAYEAATRAHNIGAVMELIADDAIYLFSNQTSHVGKAAIRLAIEANFEIIRNETYVTSKLKWLTATNDSAVCVYEFAWTGEIEGQVASGGGRGTTVLSRIYDEWRIIHEHLSRGPL